MLDELTEREFRYWMAWCKLHPIGDERADLRSGLGFSALCNSWGGKTKVQDFMPFTEFNEAEIDAKIEIQKAREIALRLGASRIS